METEAQRGHVTFQGHSTKRGEGKEMNIYEFLPCAMCFLWVVFTIILKGPKKTKNEVQRSSILALLLMAAQVGGRGMNAHPERSQLLSQLLPPPPPPPAAGESLEVGIL